MFLVFITSDNFSTIAENALKLLSLSVNNYKDLTELWNGFIDLLQSNIIHRAVQSDVITLAFSAIPFIST